MKKWGVAVLLSVCSAAAMASCQLPAYNAVYGFSMNGKYLGSVHDSLSMTDGKYRFNSDVRISVKVLLMHFTDFITATSVGIVRDHQFVPQHFVFSERRKNQHISRELKAGNVDSQTALLAIRAALVNAKPPATPVNVWLNKKLQKARVQVVKGDSAVKTPLGRLATTKVSFSTSDGTRATYWFAKKYQYLLVKSSTRTPKGAVSMRTIDKYQPNASQCVFN